MNPADIAAAYGLGPPTGPMLPAARGELGRVHRLPTEAGPVAVKELWHPPTETAARADVAFQLTARAAGVTLPTPLLTPAGDVLARTGGSTVRAYEWVDLRPLGPRPTALVGALLATLHRAAAPTTEPRHPWFVEPVGSWAALLTDCRDAPFAAALAGLRPELEALDALLPTAVRGDERRCHLDLNDGNLGWDAAGRLVVLDWENSGPASATGELAMVAAEYGPDLVAAYTAAGGPGRLRDRHDFGVAVAVQAHLVELHARRWLAGEDRARQETQLAELVADPLTLTRIDALL